MLQLYFTMAIYSPSIELAEQPTLYTTDVARATDELFGDVVQCRPLSGGSNPDVFSVESHSQRGVVKFFPAGSYQAEFEAAGMERAWQAEVPLPRVLGRGVLATEMGERPWLAMEHASGRPMSEVNLSLSEQRIVLHSLGNTIARLHTQDAEGLDGFWRQTGSDNGHATWRFNTWHDYLGHMHETLENDAPYLSAAGLSTAEIDVVLTSTAEYQHMPPSRAGYCHADLRPEHVYLDRDKNITSIIDWGSGQANAPEREFSKPLTGDDEAMVKGYAEVSGVPHSELGERIKRMQIAHLPALVIFNVKKNRPADAQARIAELRAVLGGRTPEVSADFAA